MAYFVNLTKPDGGTIRVNPETVVAILDNGAKSSLLITTANSNDGGPFIIQVSESTEQVDSALSI